MIDHKGNSKKHMMEQLPNINWCRKAETVTLPWFISDGCDDDNHNDGNDNYNFGGAGSWITSLQGTDWCLAVSSSFQFALMLSDNVDILIDLSRVGEFVLKTNVPLKLLFP